MGGEGSKQPTSCKVILFKSNIFRNLNPMTPLSKVAKHAPG